MPDGTGSFALQPTLHGNLLTLRPLRFEDFDELFEVARDPLIWEQHPEPDRFRREVFLEFFHGAIASGGAFAIIDRDSGTIIGSSRYCDFQPDKKEIEIGFTFLQRRFWGGAYNRELKSIMLQHAFGQQNETGIFSIDRVVFVIGETNGRSQKAMSKIGARVYQNKETRAPDGTMQRNVVYTIARDSASSLFETETNEQ